MAGHRYWRATAFEAYGGGALELSEFHLLAGTSRVDATATLTANLAPTAGSTADLQDDVLSTGVLWSNPTEVQRLSLQWDFGASPQDVTDIRLGSASSQVRFALIVRIDYSDDGLAWTTYTVFAGISWPGPRAKTVSVFRYLDVSSPQIVSYLSMEGTDGGVFVGDRTSKAWTVNGGAVVSAEQKRGGRTSVRLNGTSAYLEASSSADWEFGAGDWTIEMMVRIVGAPSDPATGTLMERWNTFGIFMNYTVPDYLPRFGLTAAASGTVAPLGANPIPLGEWVHVAYVRSGTNLLTFVNGVVGATVADFTAAIDPVSETMSIGRDSSGVRYSNAYIDEWRVTKGKAQYVGNFDPNFSFIQINAVPGRAQRAGLDGVGFGSPVSSYSASPLPSVGRGRNDYLSGVLGKGVGRVRGKTLDHLDPSNIPYRARVRLIREIDGMSMREVWASADGSYDFQYVDELQTYTVLAYYLNNAKRAVVTDGLSLANGKVELMP